MCACIVFDMMGLVGGLVGAARVHGCMHCVCVDVHVKVCTHWCVSVHVCMREYMHVCMCVYVCTYMRECMHVF